MDVLDGKLRFHAIDVEETGVITYKWLGGIGLRNLAQDVGEVRGVGHRAATQAAEPAFFHTCLEGAWPISGPKEVPKRCI